jgi:serine/threonine protein phosphatase 1
MSKQIIFSDLHGCLDKFQNLLEKLSFTKNDTLIFLGDYIDRGENSRAVVDLIIGLREKCNVVTLSGNHEIFFLDSLKFFEGKFSYIDMFNSWLRNGGVQTLRSYAPKHVENCDWKDAIEVMDETHGEFYRSLIPIYETENHIFVHGGINMAQTVDDQDLWYCAWSRFDDMKEPHISGKTVVCGHTIQHGGIADEGYKICLDTGSFRADGYITAMIIDGNKISYVNSK